MTNQTGTYRCERCNQLRSECKGHQSESVTATISVNDKRPMTCMGNVDAVSYYQTYLGASSILFLISSAFMMIAGGDFGLSFGLAFSSFAGVSYIGYYGLSKPNKIALYAYHAYSYISMGFFTVSRLSILVSLCLSDNYLSNIAMVFGTSAASDDDYVVLIQAAVMLYTIAATSLDVWLLVTYLRVAAWIIPREKIIRAENIANEARARMVNVV